MRMSKGANSPQEYVSSFNGWVGECLRYLREHVTGAAELKEEIKWGHLVYSSNGPVLYIRAGDDNVLFGFWRGKRLRDIEPAFITGGKYEMAKLVICARPYPSPSLIKELVCQAVLLNEDFGNPQAAAKK